MALACSDASDGDSTSEAEGGSGSGAVSSVDGAGQVASPPTPVQGTSAGSEVESCFGVAGTASLSDLGSAEVEAACRAYRECARIEYTADEACRVYAAIETLFGESPAQTQDDVAPRCQEVYDACAMDPIAIVEALEAGEQQLIDAPCNHPSACSATFDDFFSCVQALAEVNLSGYPSCSELSLDSELGKLELPAVCSALGGDCFDFLLIGGTSSP